MYTNILFRSMLFTTLVLLQGCISHPSPKPKEHIAPIKINHKKKTPKIKSKNIYFEKDSYKLDTKARSILESFIHKLKSNPKITISIVGRASEEGSKGYNLVLSRSRASTVANYIIDHNVSSRQIVRVYALGEDKPLCSNNTEECHKLNRMVMIAPGDLTPSSKEYQLIDTRVEMLYYGKSKEEIKQELLELHKNKNNKYLISSGDVFNISIYGEPELSVKGGVVKPDGTLTVSMVGDVKVSGLSVNEAMDKISKKLNHFLEDAIVSLIPVKFKAQSYTILGKVNSPGNYPIQENTRLLDTIADGGGFAIGLFQSTTIELADLEHAFIRRGIDVLPVDFTELVRKGNPLHNIPLKDKDYIYIPSSLNTEVYVLGEVQSPGYFGYQEKMTLTQLISHANGYKDTAHINQVAVIRNYVKNPSVYIVDLEKIIEGKAIDFMLKPYDIVFIPKSYVADWKIFLDMVTPSLNALTNGYATYYIFKDTN